MTYVRSADGAVAELDGHVEPVAEGAAVGVGPLRGQRWLTDDETLHDRARGPGLCLGSASGSQGQSQD